MKRWQKILGIAAAIVIAVLVVLSFVLDGILTSKAREEAQKLSQEWGRPVQIGGVSTKFLTGLGVRVDERTQRVTVIACEDNLMKGAAGQAIQNFNVVFGFDEATALN